MSTHVHRDGAHKITIQDDAGRQAVLTSENHTLQVTTSGIGPQLTPQMARELAEELQQWATCQQTVRYRPRPASSDGLPPT